MSPSKKDSAVSESVRNDRKNEQTPGEVAKRASDICQGLLHQSQIPHELEIRTKNLTRPEEGITKLQGRGHHYDTAGNTQEDTTVFSATCIHILLDDWMDMNKMTRILSERFDIQEENPVSVIDDDGQSGDEYHAVHAPSHLGIDYRVQLKGNKTTPSHGQIRPHKIQIQVRTIVGEPWEKLMRLWQSSADSDTRNDWMRNTLSCMMNLTQTFMFPKQQDKARSNAKMIKPFVSPEEAGNTFRKEIESRVGQRFEGRIGSSEALNMFLDAKKKNTRRDLRELVERLDLDTKLEETKKVYRPTEMNLVIYLMDQVLLDGNDCHLVESSPTSDYHQCILKVKILMSTVVWGDKLFTDFTKYFLGPPEENDTFQRALYWLRSAALYEWLQTSKQSDLDREGLENLKRLWSWFGEHKERPVQLAFAMSKAGMIRDVSSDRSHFECIFEAPAVADMLMGFDFRIFK